VAAIFQERREIKWTFQLPQTFLQLVVKLVITRRTLKAEDGVVLCDSEYFFEVKPEDAFENFHVAVLRNINGQRRTLGSHQ